jgi:hypothetical protein
MTLAPNIGGPARPAGIKSFVASSALSTLRAISHNDGADSEQPSHYSLHKAATFVTAPRQSNRYWHPACNPDTVFGYQRLP